MKLKVIENEYLKLSILPDLGGKITSFIDKASGQECLFQRKDFQLEPTIHSKVFHPHAYGFDECFPSIEACKIQQSGKPIDITDHGELWNKKTKSTFSTNKAFISYQCTHLNLTLEKVIQLKKSEARFDYRLINHSTEMFTYIWAAHPLFNVSVGDIIEFPEQFNFDVYWDSSDWVKSINLPKHYELRLNSSAGKYFTPWDGSTIKILTSQLSIGISSEKTTHLGFWLCQGGWPSAEEQLLTVGIEPTNAPTDDLSKVEKHFSAAHLNGLSEKNWSMKFSIEQR